MSAAGVGEDHLYGWVGKKALRQVCLKVHHVVGTRRHNAEPVPDPNWVRPPVAQDVDIAPKDRLVAAIPVFHADETVPRVHSVRPGRDEAALVFPTVFLLLAPFLLRDGEFTLLNAQLRPLSDEERSGADDGA